MRVQTFVWFLHDTEEVERMKLSKYNLTGKYYKTIEKCFELGLFLSLIVAVFLIGVVIIENITKAAVLGQTIQVINPIPVGGVIITILLCIVLSFFVSDIKKEKKKEHDNIWNAGGCLNVAKILTSSWV